MRGTSSRLPINSCASFLKPVNVHTFLRLCLSSHKAKEQSLICDGLYFGKMPTPREVLKDYLPVVFDLVKTTSLVVIAASGIHLGYHVHEMTHEGVIWRDPPADIDHSGHSH